MNPATFECQESHTEALPCAGKPAPGVFVSFKTGSISVGAVLVFYLGFLMDTGSQSSNFIAITLATLTFIFGVLLFISERVESFLA